MKGKFLKSERMDRKLIISIIISIIIFSLVIFNLYKINYGKEESNYKAEKGILDLSNWDIDEEKIVDLDGEWEFYSGMLIDPKEDFNNINKDYINVPGSWEPYLKDEGLKNGSGTYRLLIKLPEDRQYGVKARTIRVANKIYLNEDQVAQVGNPSIISDQVIPGSLYNIGIGESLNGEIELIVQVTSRNFRSGGIIKSIQFGKSESILMEENKNIGIDALVVSVCLVLGLYFFLTYLQRNRNPYLLYFSIANIFMGISLSTMNEQILRLLYDYSYTVRTRIQIICLLMVSISFLRFIHCFFEEFSNKKTVNRITGILMIMFIFSFFDPIKPKIISFGNIQAITTLSMAIAYAYMFSVLIKLIKKKIDSWAYILVITVAMFSYWFLLGLKTFLELDLGHIPVALILIIMFGVAALMSHRLQLDYQEANDLSEKLIRYDKLKDDFLIKSSHKIRRPLEAILNLTKTLREGKRGPLKISQQEDLLNIYQEAKILSRLTDDLLDASSIKRGRIKVRLSSVNPYKTVEDILEEIEILTPHKEGVIIRNEIPEEFPALKADLDKFRQITYDIVHNAIKFTESGEIVISASIKNGQARISVKDTGIGIEEKDLEEIFDIFYQKDEEGFDPGLGLGLAIVKDLVEDQEGIIKVKSIYGKGSDFSFTLPLDNRTIKESNRVLEPLPILEGQIQNNLDGPKILIIEAIAVNQQIISNSLKELNYNIIIANSGKEALDILKNKRIDLIISNFILPDMASSKLTKEIRQEYSMGELPILILTTSRRTIDLMSEFNYEVNDFQKKPIDLEELKTRIQSLLLMKQSGEEALEKEFQYFYSQISPHFLYNTLNSIIGLSYIDSEKTRKALNNLSIYFRGKLDIHKKKGLVSLESELELLRAYLEMEEMRYGDRLKIEYDIEEGLRVKIPPLTLQAIVENAVHHGIASQDNGGKIKVTTKKEPKGFISIIIEDNGKGIYLKEQKQLLEGNGKGIGFRNVVERIKILKGASLTLESEIDKGTRVKIVIPGGNKYEDNFS